MRVSDDVLRFGVGRTIKGFKVCGDGLWVVLDDNSIIVFGDVVVGWSCVGCEDKKGLVVSG